MAPSNLNTYFAKKESHGNKLIIISYYKDHFKIQRTSTIWLMWLLKWIKWN